MSKKIISIISALQFESLGYTADKIYLFEEDFGQLSDPSAAKYIDLGLIGNPRVIREYDKNS